jgi:Cu/Ag efflux pump CusA
MIEGLGVRADFAVKVFGPDLAELNRIGGQIAAELRKIPGAADVSMETLEGLPQLQITLDRERAARYGLHAQDVMDAIEAAFAGKVATTVVQGNQKVEVALRFAPAYRDAPEAIGRLLLPTASGGRVPLSQVARIEVVEGPVRINRENGQRRVLVLANARGRDLGTMAEEAHRRIARLNLPVGYWIEYGGAYEHLVSGRARLSIVVPATFGAILLLLVLALGNLRYALMVFTAIPFALTGGILALWVRGMPFSMSAGVGFIGAGRDRRAERAGDDYRNQPVAPTWDALSRGGSHRRAAADATRADDRGGGEFRLPADGDLTRHGRGGAASAGDRRDWRADYQHAAHADCAADALCVGGRRVGGARVAPPSGCA